MAYGKSIELFLVNGTADSLITAELSNWNGKAIKIPRIEVSACNRDDIKQAGVYFLFCKEDNGKDSVYIGEAENVKERLVQHLRDAQAEKEKYYWNTAIKPMKYLNNTGYISLPYFDVPESIHCSTNDLSAIR